MLHALAKCWWLLLLRGIAAIVFGVLAFAWPGLTLVTLVLLYGAFALVDGVLALIAAFTGGAKPVPTWWLILVGLVGIAAGLVTFLWPGITAIVPVMFIGAWALVHGIFEIIGAIQLRKEIDNEWMLILGGAVGAVRPDVLIAPGAGALGLVWAIATYSIVFGILFVASAAQLSYTLTQRRRKFSHTPYKVALRRRRTAFAAWRDRCGPWIILSASQFEQMLVHKNAAPAATHNLKPTRSARMIHRQDL